MKIQFSQKRFRNTGLTKQIHDILYGVIPPKYRKGLLIKIMFYINPDYSAYWAGNYRNIYRHGLYESEWNMKGIDSVITLKIGQQVPSDKLIYLIAHETGHHIIRSQNKRGGEKKADKIAEKLIKRYKDIALHCNI